MSRLDRLRAAITPWIWLVYPGIVLHEYTHYAVARALGARPRVLWRSEFDRPIAEIRWQGRPRRGQVALAHLAPTVVGLPIAVVGTAAVAGGILAGALGTDTLALGLYGVINLVGYAAPSRADVRPLTDWISERESPAAS